MKIKEFIKIIEKLPDNCEIKTGNATICEGDIEKDIDALNFYTGFTKKELEKDFTKIKRLIIWGDE